MAYIKSIATQNIWCSICDLKFQEKQKKVADSPDHNENDKPLESLKADSENVTKKLPKGSDISISSYVHRTCH